MYLSYSLFKYSPNFVLTLIVELNVRSLTGFEWEYHQFNISKLVSYMKYNFEIQAGIRHFSGSGWKSMLKNPRIKSEIFKRKLYYFLIYLYNFLNSKFLSGPRFETIWMISYPNELGQDISMSHRNAQFHPNQFLSKNVSWLQTSVILFQYASHPRISNCYIIKHQ